ncbi:RING-box protein HRT1-like [Diaphorina citri]|uniref:RING-box protein HRT1-like n=1 Tax=Diaphorina citri TaxID=121845 RepID=A0A1S3D985_DIACI|nr:RING-box protein HRT1-like [Diaphorina citri]XP_008477048.1 RING-box protein HRT1-like isoform X1 [Diaphorina citri]XP_008477049.1 RING-box protein HRT1-like isoform X1 [Diaphorina citri]XP_008477050.1 RING-box protein HRT1-like isoform X1 [Diaphorina citri]XP_008477051.1 RING-box protein HRT1-like isoform X1 [Diaphorina citri]XP_026682852.1 RING-box protein HRT1-like [Diaphorina citri]
MEKMDVESTKPEKMDTDSKSEKMFTLKKWNAVAMWSWDVECDTCAICRVQVMVPIPGLRRREDPSILTSGDICGPAYSKSTLPIAMDIFNKHASALEIADNMEVFKEKTKAILYI